MISKARSAYQVVRHLGSRWAAYRLLYALRQRSGQIERVLPITTWEAQPLASWVEDRAGADTSEIGAAWRRQSKPFFFAPASDPGFGLALAAYDGQDSPAIAAAERLLQGRLTLFSHLETDPGSYPDWHWNPLSNQALPHDIHWSRLSEFAYGDIKGVWEASRFSFAFTLVRAYWRTGDERYPAAFWRLLYDWRDHNPPQAGPNWKCGQETSLRVLAWTFALYGFLHSSETTDARVADLMQMIAVSGKRIEHNIEYALSQRNNHAISEAAGLWTIGLLFPQLRLAEHWRERGRVLLERLAQELIYDDGAFVQHSMNYHRLMLHVFLWAIRLGELHGQPLSPALVKRVGVACDFLLHFVDPLSGRVPNYGANDGAHLLPLTNCDYSDFRPVLQSASLITRGCRAFAKGPWDEESAWLCGADAADARECGLPSRDLAASAGGYYIVRGDESRVMTRCATFRDRPSHADLLHVDLWWRGQNIAIDPGTYSYNASAPWDNGLAGTAVHNTVSVDGFDQMDKQSRFLWLPWAHGTVTGFVRSDTLPAACFQGEHNGYLRLKDPVSHRRSIVYLGHGGDTWIVVDWLSGLQEHTYRLHWLLDDYPWAWLERDRSLQLTTPAGLYFVQTLAPQPPALTTLERADLVSARGWKSPYYAGRLPALSLAMEIRASQTRFVTCFSDRPLQCTVNEDGLRLNWSDGTAAVTLDSQKQVTDITINDSTFNVSQGSHASPSDTSSLRVTR